MDFATRLPPKIVSNIWNRINLDTPYSIFITIGGEALRLARNLRLPPYQQILELAPGSKLSISYISIFGVDYIRNLLHIGESDDENNENDKYII
jgi:hypothetical protein